MQTVLVYLTKAAACRIGRKGNGWYVVEAGVSDATAHNIVRTWRAKGYRVRVHPASLVVIDPLEAT